MTIHTNPRSLSRTRLRSSSRALALEPRLLFDGAGAVAAVDHVDMAGDHHAEAQQQEAPPAADARPSEAAEKPAQMAATLVVIDARVADYQSILDQLPADAIVRVVEANESGLNVVGAELAKGRFEAIHIFSHGGSGSFTLGTDTLSNDALANQAVTLNAWAGQLTENADILLYGCDIAQGEAGQAFISELAHLTGADIAASTNATGNAGKGGDWVLESATGSIEAGVFGFAGYGELLAAPTVTNDAPPDKPVTVGENTGGTPGGSIKVTGTGADSLIVTASVGKGTLSATNFTGTATQVETWLAGLTYTYTGTSETGDSDTLTLSIVNDTSGGTTPFTRSFTIAPENDAPVLTPPASGAGRLSVAEGSTVNFAAGTGTGTAGSPINQVNLGLVDPDNSQAQIIIKLTGQPSQGVLLLNGNELTLGSTFAVSNLSQLAYKHNGTEVLATTTDSFTITVGDGAGGLLTNQTVTIDITPKNDAPSASGTIVLIEGETNVALVGGTIPVIGGARGDLAIADPDDSAHTVQITGLPTNGTLKYNSVDVTLNQIIANANLSLFTYDHSGSEPTSDSFKIKVTDAGGGEGAAITTAEQTINLTIIPNNDDPYWDGSTLPDGSNAFGPVVFGPGSGTANTTTTLTITHAMLYVRDAESGPEKLTYTLTAIPTGGYLTSSAYPGQYLPVGFTFTQKDIDDGKISFVNTTGNSHSTDFKFTVMDGDRRLFASPRDGGIYADDGQGTPLTVHTFKIDYQGTDTGTGPGGSPPTAAPTPTIDKNLGLTDAQIAEGQSFTLSDTYLKASSTGSAPEQITYRLLTLPSNGSVLLNDSALGLLGSFTQDDINNGRVKFQHDDSEDFTASFTFDVSNGSQITAAQTFNIDTKPQNDMPVAGQGDTVKLTEGSTIVLNADGKTHITLADKDNDPSDKVTDYAADNTLSFKVTVLPTQGTLEWNNGGTWQAVTVNQVITQEDLTAGKLRYTHGGTENYTDNFTIVPVDDKSVVTGSNNTNANTHAPSTDPTNQASEGAAKVISISVNPLNDAPTYVSKAEPGYDGKPALKEGAEFTIWGATYSGGTYGTGSGTATPESGKDHYLVYQDTDNTSEQRQYRITSAPQYGTLTAGGRTLSVGSVFTQAELDSGAVKYQHGGGEQFDDKFEYVVSDGDYSANQTGSAAQGQSITPSEYRIKLERSNDKPTISTSHSGLFVVDSSNTAKTLPTITLGDSDLADGVQTGETNFVQVTVEFLDGSNAAYTNGILHFTTTTGVALIGVNDGNKLVLQGELAHVQTALNLITAKTNGADADLDNLKIKVTVDDRLRDGITGVLTSGANGGALNQDGSTPNDIYNTASITINVAASDKNDLPVVTAVGQTVLEDVRTQLTGISYTDPDAFGSASNNTLTLTVGSGKLYFHASNITVTGGATVSAGAVGSNTVTLQGTKTQLDAALASLYYMTATDYNGDDSLTVTVSDGNNYGQDGDEGSAGDANKTVAIAITPVNDAPTLTGTIAASALKPITGASYTFAANELNFDDAKDISNGVGSFTAGIDEYTVTLNVTSGTLALTNTTGLTIHGNNTATVTLTGSRANIQAAITTPSNNVTFTADNNNGDATVTFTMTVNDLGNGGTGISGNGGDLTATRSFTLIPTSQNDAPSITGLDVSKAYTENSTITIDSNVDLVDPELDLYPNWSGAVLTIERNGGANAEDQFGVTGSGNTGVNFSGSNIRIGTTVVGTFTNTGGTLDITFKTNATAARVDQVIRAITYKNLSDKPPASIELKYSINDQNKHAGDAPQGTGQDQGAGGPKSGTASITLNVTKTVDSPVLSAPGLNAQFTENGSAVTVDNTLTLTDADDDNIHSATVAITGNFLEGDTLAVDITGTSISASFDAGTGVLTLTGVDSKAHYQQVLRSLTYVTASDDPTDNTTKATRTLTYTVNDNGSDGAGTAGTNPGTTTRTVTVIPVNDTPAIVGAGSTHTFTENGSAITLEPGSWTLTDVDDTQMVEAKVWISSGFKAGDVLDASSLPGGWTKNYNASTGELTLSGSATDIANVLAALKTVTYISTSDDPGNANRTISWQVKDANSDAASNGQLTTNVVTTTVHVTPVNDPPVATPNTNNVTEDSGTNTATGNVKTDGTPDSDPDNLMSSVPVTSITATTAGGSATTVADNAGAGTVVTGKYGTLTIHPDGSYTYVLDNTDPDVNALTDSGTLTEVFNYTIKDPGDLTASSTLTITINGHTDGTPQIVPVDGNTGATGEATVNESGLVGGSEAATDKETTTGSITLTAPDGLKEVTIGGTTFTVAQLQALSTASPSTVINTGEGELHITGITVNTGPAGAPKDASIGYTYTLKAAQTHTGATATESTDVVALEVKDVNDVTGSGNLTIQIVDDVPTASNDTNSITKGAATVTGNAFTNDSIGADGAAVGGPVTAITGGTLGSALAGSYGSITLNADGSYSYALDNSNLAVTALQSGQTLTDTFTYTITDKDGDTSTATVTITINGYTPPPPNQVPVAVDDNVTLDEDVPYTGTLTGNDTPSPDGGNVWSKTTDPQHGTVVVNPGGTFTYTPNPDYNGPDSFTYTITDANGDKSTATVTLTVRPVNDVPVATPDSTTTPKDKPVSGNLASNDMPSPDGGNVWSKTTDPSHGTVVVNPDGTYTYTPNTGFTGTDTFTYTVTDKDGDKSTATVTIKVGDNGVPVAVNDSTTTPKDKPVSGNLAGNDTPSPDGGNVWSKTTDPSHGAVVVNPDGTYTYTPNEGFTGTDSFTYTITDKDGDKSTATVTVTVGGGVTPPVTPPVNPPVDPTNPPVLPPVIGGPDGPGTPGGPDLPPVIAPVPPVLPSDTLTIDQPVPAGKSPALTLNSPVILDAGPYFANERFDDVRRMVLPFHPIVYVNREVASSQAQRAQDDPRGFSDPSAAVPGERPPVSLGAGLGQDPNLFVSHAIRDSQSVASFLRSTVEGRYSRLGLGSDGYLASPGLFSQPATEISELLKEQRKKLKKAAGEASAAVAEHGQGDAPATQPQIARAAGQPDRAAAPASGGVAAPSFNEQLRSGAARLPMAARKV